MPDSATFAERLGALIRSHRAVANRSQIEVALAVGVSNRSFSGYELGHTLPSLPVLVAILRELEIDPDEILSLLDDDPEPANGRAA